MKDENQNLQLLDGLIGKVGTQGAMIMDYVTNVLGPMLRTAEEQPLDVYLDWGKYDMRSPDEKWDMGQGNRSFAALLKEKGYAPVGGEANDGTGWSSWSNRTDQVFEALFPAEGRR